MKSLFVLSFIVLFSNIALANHDITVTTGYGYLQDDQGHIVSKAELPVGNHNIKDGLAYLEVADKDNLDAINLYVPEATAQEKKKALRQEALDKVADSYIDSNPELAAKQADILTENKIK